MSEISNSTEESTHWYIVKNPSGTCDILSNDRAGEGKLEAPEHSTETWETVGGPFPSYSEAIARRVGLIRAGKCKPQ
ncbi:MAG: DDE transposase family protein [Cyanobacteriota bacterium]|nr:DDE transposase family protein [Cyanobacteriota bacterium]